MEIKCPNCGAGIDSDGKFCKYCGTKLPDNTQKFEINGKLDHTVNGKIEHRFSWGSQARIEKINRKAELEKYKLEHADEIQKREMKETLMVWGILFALIGVIVIFVVILKP